MIYTDKQYSVSKTQLAKLQEALVIVERAEVDQPWLKKAQIDALKSQITDMASELAEYDLLKSGQISFSKSYALDELPRVLVQARIAGGMSQTELAEKLGMKPQQVQRYEATDYMGASLARLIEIARVLDVKASGSFEATTPPGSSVFAWTDSEDIIWSQLPYKEMARRKWLDLPRGSNPIEEVKAYFLKTAGPHFASAYHRKKMRSGNIPNEYALLAWQARILERARNFTDRKELSEFELDDRWLPELVKLTGRKEGPKLASELLAKKGVVLIIEKHLTGSYLDGAAMLSDSGCPVIGLTLRYDRLDNFWFVLMHELGHVFLHLFDGLRFDFFDEECASSSDSIEMCADKFALDALLPEGLWDQCLSRFALSAEAVQIDANNLGIHPSIIAGRIRKERNDYTILPDLVGQGEVRRQFEEAGNDLD